MQCSKGLSRVLQKSDLISRLLLLDPSRHRRSAAPGGRRQRQAHLQLRDGGGHPLLGQVVQGRPRVLQVGTFDAVATNLS